MVGCVRKKTKWGFVLPFHTFALPLQEKQGNAETHRTI